MGWEGLSPGREYDRAARTVWLRAMRAALALEVSADPFMKGSYMRGAKEFGQEASRLAKRIETFDYTEQDRMDTYLLTPKS